VRSLSGQSKYFRFMMAINELTPAMLARFTQIDYDREMAFLAVIEQGGEEVEIGVARYVINPDGKSCEFAIVVADTWQHHGIAHRLMECLIQAAKGRDLEMMEGEVLANNSEMLQLVTGLGFSVEAHPDDPGLRHIHKYL